MTSNYNTNFHRLFGDINGNGSVDIGDALSLSTLVAGGSVTNVCGTGHALDCADLFKDGKIDNADLSVLVDHIAGLKTLFDICTGPSDAKTLTCSGNDPDTGRPVANLGAQTITQSQIWPANCTVPPTRSCRHTSRQRNNAYAG